ncbi:MAG: nitroreductase family protein [Dehalococcoidia bacterium]|nr:MAG: nitroreductase family protein [Dehalococcoidia bacterium]
MEVLEAIRTRRSVRRYKTTPIDDKTLELVLEAARWAPSWNNTQCWRFILVRDDKVKKELATTIPKANRAHDCVENAPVTIVACAEIGKSGYLHGKFIPDKDEWWYMFDVALAMQNLVLAAHSLGLGTVYTGWFDNKKAGSILGVPPGFTVVTLTPLGYPDLTPKTTPRRELSQTVFYDRFKS